MTRRLGVALVALLVVPAPALGAQIAARLHLGVLTSTSLVRDSIVRSLTVDPDLAVAATVGLDWTVSPRLAASGELALARADLDLHEGTAERTVMAVTTLSVTAGLMVPLVPRATGRVGIGGIHYFPGDESGIFARGSSTSVTGTAAVAYRWPLSERLELGAEVRYDLHTFTTPALEALGFDGARVVHRFGLGVSIGHRWGA